MAPGDLIRIRYFRDGGDPAKFKKWQQDPRYVKWLVDPNYELPAEYLS